jgi:regulatory protein
MAGRRARTGRGWDAAPPRARSGTARQRAADADGARGPRGVSAPAPDERSLDGRAADPDGLRGSFSDGRGFGQPRSDGPGSGGSSSDGRAFGRPGFGGRRRRSGSGSAWPDSAGAGYDEAGSAGAVDPRSPHDGGSAERDHATRAREICLRLLAVRPRTRQELAAALHQRGIPDEVAAEILQRYGEVGMVDDRAFARAWVTSRHHGKGLAGRALAGELRRKGVEPDAIGEALDELSDGVEARTARELIDRKLRHDRGGAPDATMRRLVGLLARKGYAPGLAFRVVKEAMAAAVAEQMDGPEEPDGIAAEELEAALEAAVLDADAAESEADL